VNVFAVATATRPVTWTSDDVMVAETGNGNHLVLTSSVVANWRQRRWKWEERRFKYLASATNATVRWESFVSF